MLMPALQQARNAAKTSSCLSNIKQVGGAIINYGSDNNDILVPASVWLPEKMDSQRTNRGLVHPGTKNECPWLYFVFGYIGKRSEITHPATAITATPRSPRNTPPASCSVPGSDSRPMSSTVPEPC